MVINITKIIQNYPIIDPIVIQTRNGGPGGPVLGAVSPISSGREREDLVVRCPNLFDVWERAFKFQPPKLVGLGFTYVYFNPQTWGDSTSNPAVYISRGEVVRYQLCPMSTEPNESLTISAT